MSTKPRQSGDCRAHSQTYRDESWGKKIIKLCRVIYFMSFYFLLCNYQEDALSNVVSSVYSLSKIPAFREQLVCAGVDRLLLKLSQGDSDKVKANVSRALKNLSSDASENIEEGAVAALIAMSLEVF